MALGHKTGGRQKGTPNKQTHAEKAAFALEAAALLEAEGIDVLSDLTAAYRIDRKPMFHKQRFGYTMLRHLDRARTAQAIAARQAREAQARGEPQPILIAPAPGKRELLDPVAFLFESLAEAERELQQAALEGPQSQAWQFACHHLAKVQAQIERLPCQDNALAAELAGRLAQSRDLAARLAPSLETKDAADQPNPVIASTAKQSLFASPSTEQNGGAPQPAEIPSEIIANSDKNSTNRENAAPLNLPASRPSLAPPQAVLHALGWPSSHTRGRADSIQESKYPSAAGAHP
jgi:hypothetical protein